MKSFQFKTQLTVTLFLLFFNTTFAQWSNVNPINDFGRYRAATFVIGDTAYLGNGDNPSYTNDFWKYTQASNTWVQIQSYPSGGGDQGFRFTINDTAYVGDGADPGFHNDFYAYTPSAGWMGPLAVPPGGGRVFGAGFSIGNKGYFGTGFTSSNATLNDFYSYDEATHKWDTLASLPIGRAGAVAFSANGKGYIGLGYKDNVGTAAVYQDMYQYDPVTNTWATMASLPGAFGEAEPAYFVLCGKLIVTSGETTHQSGSVATNQTWMFDPSNGLQGTWTRLQDFPGNAEYSPEGFAMGDTGFVFGGCVLSTNTAVVQMWRYVPTLTLTPALAADTVVCAGTSITLNASGGATYIWSTNDTTGGANDTTSSITVSPLTTTTYYYTATGNPCYNLDSIVIKVKSSSTLTVEPQSPRACNGQSVALSVPASGTNYTWSPTQTLSSSTTDTVIATPTITTVYIVTGNDSAGCLATGTDSVYVVTASPLIIQPQSSKVCNGQGVTLYAPSSGTGYTWSSGVTTSSGDSATATPTVTTTYSVTGTDSLGCVATGTDSVYVIPAPPLIIQPVGTQTICPGQSITLSVTTSGSGYIWNPSTGLNQSTGDTVVATLSVPTTYTVSGIDSLGCSVGSDSEIIDLSNAPNKPTITRNGDVLTSSATQGNQWVRNDSILNGATGENDTATVSGYYQVIAENPANGCSTTSDSVYVTTTGINQLSVSSNQLSIYPNPTNGEITLNISSSAGELKDWYLQVTDVLGRTVYTRQSLNYSNAIDLSNLASGVYFICVMNKTDRAVVPVVKQN